MLAEHLRVGQRVVAWTGAAHEVGTVRKLGRAVTLAVSYPRPTRGMRIVSVSRRHVVATEADME